MSKIIVTGATGHFGKAAIESLIQKSVEKTSITGLVRDESKASDLKELGVNIAIGDYNDTASLTKAFIGNDVLLFVSGSDLENRTAQHENVVKAAKEAGIKHVLYTSFVLDKHDNNSPLTFLADSHIRTEKLITDSGIPYTFLRNNLYMDFVPAFIGEQAVETGTIYLPAKNGLASVALRSEMAEATAQVIASGGHQNKIYDFTNVESYSYDDVANYLSDITGKTIQFVSPSGDEYTQTLVDAGVPVEFASTFSSFAVAQAQGELDVISTNLNDLLGRKPTTLKDYLKTIYSIK
jgi:NAD(P)H dehydrogenase (quinone)